MSSSAAAITADSSLVGYVEVMLLSDSRGSSTDTQDTKETMVNRALRRLCEDHALGSGTRLTRRTVQDALIKGISKRRCARGGVQRVRWHGLPPATMSSLHSRRRRTLLLFALAASVVVGAVSALRNEKAPPGHLGACAFAKRLNRVARVPTLCTHLSHRRALTLVASLCWCSCCRRYRTPISANASRCSGWAR